MDLATLIVIVTVCLVAISIGILRLRGHSYASVYDSFEKRSLTVKILMTIVVIIILSYAGYVLFAYIAVEYEFHFEQINSSSEQQYNKQRYNDLIDSA